MLAVGKRSGTAFRCRVADEGRTQQLRPCPNVRLAEGLLAPDTVAITGNRAALLKLRRQVYRALGDRNVARSFEEEVYDDPDGEPFEVAVKRARRRSEMREQTKRKDGTHMARLKSRAYLSDRRFLPFCGGFSEYRRWESNPHSPRGTGF